MLLSTYRRYEDDPEGQKWPACNSFQCLRSPHVTQEAFQSLSAYLRRMYSLITDQSFFFWTEIESHFAIFAIFRFSFAFASSHFFWHRWEQYLSREVYWTNSSPQCLQSLGFRIFILGESTLLKYFERFGKCSFRTNSPECFFSHSIGNIAGVNRSFHYFSGSSSVGLFHPFSISLVDLMPEFGGEYLEFLLTLALIGDRVGYSEVTDEVTHSGW